MSFETDPLSLARPRAELIRRRAARQGWLALVAGLLIPVIALWAVRIGWTLRDVDRRQGTAMMILATLVFVVRLGLYVFGQHHENWPAIVLEPAASPRATALRLETHGVTEREREVAVLLPRGGGPA